MHLEILRDISGKYEGNFHLEISCRDSIGKGGNIHIENSPSFPLNFRVEIWGTRMACPLGSPGIPYKSGWPTGGHGWLARWVFKERLLCIIQNVYKTILWLNEMLMRHTECKKEIFRQKCLTKNFFSFAFHFNPLLSNGRSKRFRKPIKAFW